MEQPTTRMPMEQSESHHDPVGRYGGGSHVVFHDQDHESSAPERIRDLIRPPTIRQWIHGVGVIVIALVRAADAVLGQNISRSCSERSASVRAVLRLALCRYHTSTRWVVGTHRKILADLGRPVAEAAVGKYSRPSPVPILMIHFAEEPSGASVARFVLTFWPA